MEYYEYVLHTDVNIFYEKEECHSLIGTDKNALKIIASDFNGDFDEVCLNFKKILPHIYDANKLICKVNIKIFKPDSEKEILKLTTYIKLKVVENDNYERDLSLYKIYKGKIKILVPNI